MRPGASDEPATSAAGRSWARSTRRIPRPPPPAAALTSRGNPIASSVRDDRLDAVRPIDRGGIQGPGHGLHADRPSGPPGMQLVTERIDRVRGRTDEDDTSILDRAGEGGPFGKEPVSGMDRLGARRVDRIHHRIDAQVALGRRRRPEPDGDVGEADMHRTRVGVRVHGDRLHAHLVTGADDPDRDLPAVGDQHTTERRTHRRWHVFAQRRDRLRAGCCHASSLGWCPACPGGPRGRGSGAGAFPMA